MSSKLKLHIIGVGTPDPHGSRFGSAFVLQVDQKFIMIDCGPAAVYKMAKLNIQPTHIDRLLFTHHHFDHNADYPCFLLTQWDQDTGNPQKTHPLRIYGPPPTTALTHRLTAIDGLFHDDIIARVESPVSQLMHTNRGGSLPRWWPTYDVHDIQPGEVEANDDWRITAFRVHHMEPWLTEYGYRIETAHGVVAFTGDAGPCDALDELAKGADTLVMCSAHKGTIHPMTMAVVTGSPDVARVASKAGVKTAILTHMTAKSARDESRKTMLELASNGFDGKVLLPEEITTIDLA